MSCKVTLLGVSMQKLSAEHEQDSHTQNLQIWRSWSLHYFAKKVKSWSKQKGVVDLERVGRGISIIVWGKLAAIRTMAWCANPLQYILEFFNWLKNDCIFTSFLDEEGWQSDFHTIAGECEQIQVVWGMDWMKSILWTPPNRFTQSHLFPELGCLQNGDP